MHSLKTIQTISKIAKIISKIIFICCIVGFCGCIVGIISLAVGAPALQFGGVSFESLIQNKAGLSLGTLYANIGAGAMMCAGYAVLAKFSALYFDGELKAGTPFTFEGAKQLQTLGILSVCIPIGAQILAQIVRAVLAQFLPDVAELELEAGSSVAIGIALIIIALICKSATEHILSRPESEKTE